MIRWYVVTATDTIEEITDRVRTPDPEGSEGFDIGANADEGSAGSFSLSVDDPDADLLLLNHRRVYAIAEAAPAGHQRVGNWWISDLDIIRGDSDRTGASRTYVLTLEDENSIIPRKIQNGEDADRPAETDVERILDWLATTTEFASIKDFLHFDTTGPVELDAASFIGQNNDAVLRSCMEASGKNYFVWFNELAIAGGSIVSSSVANPTVITTSAPHNLLTGAEITIGGHSGSTPDINGVHTVTVIDDTTFTIPVNVTVGGTGGTVVEPRYSLAYFNPNTYEGYASAISLSNVASEIDSTTVFAISDDTRLNRAGGRIASGAFASGPFGTVYAQNSAVAAAYVSRDLSVPAPNVTTLIAATAQITRQLRDLDDPDDEVTTYITVTEANISAVMHGMTIPLHATHFPGFLTEDGYPTYQSGQLMRVTKRQVRQVAPEAFEIHLWLSPMAEVEPVYGILYRVDTDAGVLSERVLNWGRAGDNPFAGYPVRPTIGPIEPILDPSPYDLTYPHIGWKMLGDGTVDVLCFITYIGVLVSTSGGLPGYCTVTLRLRLNGVEIGSDSLYHTGFLKLYSGGLVVAMNGLEVVTDDVIDATLEVAGEGVTPATTPAGLGQNGERLEITGGALAA